VPLGFGRSKKEEDVVSLITEKRYARAIEVLRAQLKKRKASTTLRKQLADVLVMAGKKSEAIEVLLPLSDQFAREGFAAKAVSILKKIQKIDPGRRDVDERLARLIEEKQREAALPLRAPEIGLEEIAIEAPFSGPIDIPVDRPAPETPAAAPAETPGPAEDVPAPGAEEEPSARPTPGPPETEAPIAMPSPAEPPIAMPPPPTEDAPIPLPAPAEPVRETPVTGPAERDEKREPAEAGIEDYDLLYVPDDDEAEEEAVVPLGEVAAPSEEAAEEVMSDAAFSSELMSLVDSVFQEASEGGFEVSEPSPQAGPQRTGDQIVVSPLFRDFSVDEMVAVIQGLKLHSFERGDVIIREGQPGDSLFMLTSGRVRAFRKDPSSGKQIRIADLNEGAFFGEISMLTGQPRNASVVALKSCELLELDRPTLDEITRTHPHVWGVLREFAQKRSQARD
jgi:hypothetical protein